MSAPPLTSYLEQNLEAEDEKLSFVPSAVSEQRWALPKCDNKSRAWGFKFFEIAAVVSEEGGVAHTINFCRICCNQSKCD